MEERTQTTIESGSSKETINHGDDVAVLFHIHIAQTVEGRTIPFEAHEHDPEVLVDQIEQKIQGSDRKWIVAFTAHFGDFKALRKLEAAIRERGVSFQPVFMMEVFTVPDGQKRNLRDQIGQHVLLAFPGYPSEWQFNEDTFPELDNFNLKYSEILQLKRVTGCMAILPHPTAQARVFESFLFDQAARVQQDFARQGIRFFDGAELSLARLRKDPINGYPAQIDLLMQEMRLNYVVGLDAHEIQYLMAPDSSKAVKTPTFDESGVTFAGATLAKYTGEKSLSPFEALRWTFQTEEPLEHVHSVLPETYRILPVDWDYKTWLVSGVAQHMIRLFIATWRRRRLEREKS
ncbi:hypothetical protein JW766_02230 [Candidatus Dojkabacteria bacterium]|nr:hypothetical protein [Candidatus Dojkabacteria bacterium]